MTTDANTPEADKQSETPSPAPTGMRKLWHDWVRPILVVILVLYAFRTTIADWNDVPTGSMEPTIQPGDRIVVNKLSYDITLPYTNIKLMRWGGPARGDIIVFKSPDDGQRIVKRAVGLPGDRIEMLDKQLIINGNPIEYQWEDQVRIDGTSNPKGMTLRFGVEHLRDRPHPVIIVPGHDDSTKRNLAEVVVPEGHYFVMGDNRDDSKDSRYFDTPFIPRDNIEGRAFAVALSFDYAARWKPRWSRWFSGLN